MGKGWEKGGAQLDGGAMGGFPPGSAGSGGKNEDFGGVQVGKGAGKANFKDLSPKIPVGQEGPGGVSQKIEQGSEF